MQGVQVWLLVGEVRSHMPQSVAKNVKIITNESEMQYDLIWSCLWKLLVLGLP